MRIFLEILNLYSICDHNILKKNIDCVMNDDENRGSMLLNIGLHGHLDAVTVVI